MPKTITITLTPDQLEHLICTLEGAKEELEELSRSVDWFCTQVAERIDDCLVFLQLDKEK